MADKIKKFFAKKKSDAKFKMAGPGHKLNANSSQSNDTSKKTSKNQYVPKPRAEPTAEARLAAEAALARLGNQREKSAAFNTSLAAIQAQVKRELENEKQSALEAAKTETGSQDSHPTTSNKLDVSPHLATRGVYFRCPLVSNEVLSKNEWKIKIKEFLYEQLGEERGLTSCLIIHSCNTRDKVEPCVETLSKYLENIIAHPDEEKYHRIRMSNRMFYDKVKPVEGALDFLLSAGFQEEVIQNNDVSETFLVYKPEHENTDSLEILLDAIHNAEPVGLELDRGLQVLLPSQAFRKTQLPPQFFTMSPEDIKKEQQLRSETIEKVQMLRTKAMREKDELRELKKYKFALIRIRFPDGVFLQGTFGVYEKGAEIFDFVRSALNDDQEPFHLLTPASVRLDEDALDKTLIDLRLVPATVLTFLCELPKDTNLYLKPDLMLLVEDL